MTTATAHPDAPALAIVVKAEVLSNNLAPFREYIRGMLAEINRDLSTDEDFGQAEADTKGLKAAEDALKAAKEKALADAEALHAVLTDLDATGEEIRAVRLDLEKKIATEKERRKGELVAEAMERLDCAPRLRHPVYGRSVSESIKGKRTLDSMRKALDTIVTCHNATIAKSRGQIESFIAAHGEAMVPDREELETRSPDAVEIELRRRFEAKKAEDARRKLEEEAAKARAEAEAARKETEAVKNPEPPDAPIAAAPAAPAAETLELTAQPSEREEWESVKREIVTAFAAIKEIKGKLIHSRNQAKINGFGAAVNRAWEDWK